MNFLPLIADIALVIIVLLLLAVYRKLSQIVSRMEIAPLNSSPKVITEEVPQSEIEVESGSHFEEFLNEDPMRRDLGKKEQFAAYRTWRSAKGLNWSK